MSDPAGRLNIQLRRTPHGFACDIGSTRPVAASGLFRGRAPTETASLLPLLYSICAKAQASACVGALEHACGMDPDPEARRLRQSLVAAETVREHLWRILLDWPLLLDEEPDRHAMIGAQSLVKRIFGALDSDGVLLSPGCEKPTSSRSVLEAAASALADLTAERVLGLAPDAWLERVTTLGAFDDWCRSVETPAARLLADLHDSGDGRLGHTEASPLPDLDDGTLAAELRGPEAAAFVARPCWRGVPRETTPLTRYADSALVSALVADQGRGILARLVAQILETVSLLCAIRTGELDAGSTAPSDTVLPAGVGLGRADAARGLLVHLAEVDRGRVAEYRILAPTEWNFHPDGVLASALATLPDAEETLLRRRVQLLVMAIDPCVAFDLVIP